MGEFTFFFVESKTFEFSVEEGGTFYLLPIKKKIIYYVFLKNVEILHALSLWGRRVPKGCCLMWKSWHLSYLLCSSLERLGKEIRFLLFSWGPMLVETFCLFLNSFMDDVEGP